MKTSLTFYPNQSKTSPKTGKVPIYMRICMKGKKSETRTNAELTPSQLGLWDPITMRVLQNPSPINKQLNKLDAKFSDFMALNATQLPQFNAAYIKDYVVGNSAGEEVDVIGFVDEYFTKSVLNNVNRAHATIKTYRRAINHLKNFLKHEKKTTLSFSDLTYDLALDFSSYLVRTDPKINKIGMTDPSAANVIKKFRTIFTQAVEKGYLSRNPFLKIKIRQKSPKKDRLTIQQLKQLINLDLSLYPAQEVYRDIFLFSIFTGLAYGDAMNLRWANLEFRDKGNTKLSVPRAKTDIITESFLIPQALDIANKYRNFTEVEISGRVLPYRSNKEVNSQLKLLAFLAKNPIKLTTHIGRHTFRQLIAEAGVEDTAVIKRMMGQSRNGDVDEIYYSVTETRLLQAKAKFETYLKTHLS